MKGPSKVHQASQRRDGPPRERVKKLRRSGNSFCAQLQGVKDRWDSRRPVGAISQGRTEKYQGGIFNENLFGEINEIYGTSGEGDR